MIIEKNNIDSAVRALLNKEVVAIATDTVYGLLALYDDAVALENLMCKKNRPQEKKFPIVVKNLDMIEEIAILDDKTRAIVKHFMPGPLTVVVQLKKSSETVAFRLAFDETMLKILEGVQKPLYLTSANISGQPVLNDAQAIEEAHLAEVVIVGKPQYQQASTIIDATKKDIVVLREGPISLESILGGLANG